MELPHLPKSIIVPAYPPHCVICGCRAEAIGDFTHTNFKGAIYDCVLGESSHRFIEQEDAYFSVDYWCMSETRRKAYNRLSLGERRAFLKMRQSEQNTFIKLSKEKRQLYLLANMKYKVEAEDYDNFVIAKFHRYKEWQ